MKLKIDAKNFELKNSSEIQDVEFTMKAGESAVVALTLDNPRLDRVEMDWRSENTLASVTPVPNNAIFPATHSWRVTAHKPGCFKFGLGTVGLTVKRNGKQIAEIGIAFHVQGLNHCGMQH